MPSSVATYNLEELARKSEEILTSAIGSYLGGALLTERMLARNWQDSTREMRYQTIKQKLENLVTKNEGRVDPRLYRELLIGEALSFLAPSGRHENFGGFHVYLDESSLKKIMDESKNK